MAVIKRYYRRLPYRIRDAQMPGEEKKFIRRGRSEISRDIRRLKRNTM